MRKLVPMLASASAAALTTLTVTVAVPAIADDSTGDKGRDTFVACLHDHGLDGAPAGGAAVKQWIGERIARGDGAAKRALAACSQPDIVQPGPSGQELRSCLADHGADVPAGDGLALKRWLLAHGSDAATRGALKACGMAPVTKPGDAGACGKGAPAVRSAIRVERPKRGDGEQPAGELGGGEPRY
jgi:hypothetical protein